MSRGSHGRGISDSNTVELVRATEHDIPFVMATERTAGYETLVGRWNETQHRIALSDPRYAYFIARFGSEDVGFAIIRDWASSEHVTLIKRIAVSRADVGYGRAFLARLVDRIFQETDAYRIWLAVFPDNIRARRAYEAVGFRAEGIARGSAFFGGIHLDELVMALLRPQWRAGAGRA